MKTNKNDVYVVKSEQITITLPYRGRGHHYTLTSDYQVVSVEMPSEEELKRHNKNLNNHIKNYPVLENISAKIVFRKVVNEEK